MTETARLRFPLLAAAQAQKHVTVNEGWLVADTLVNGSVLGFADAPAGGESDGDCYIVGSGSGAFTGWDGRIARIQDGVWHSLLPGAGDGVGWIVWNQDDSQLYVCIGSGTWVPVFGLHDAMVFKGVIDCSGNPNYPAADRGWTYRVSVAGKIGGGSGVNVEAGDLLICLTDGTASGDQAAVGAHWTVVQSNLDGVVIGPASATADGPAVFDGTTGKLLKSITYAAFKAALGLTKADVGLGSVLNFPQREKLTANRTYYVRTDGSDSNDGLANNSGGAFLTIAKAMSVVAAIDLGGYTTTVQVGAGTWTVGVTLPALVGGSAILLGDETTPANVAISVSAGTNIFANGIGGGWSIRGVKLERSVAGQLLFVTNNSAVTFQNVDFGAITGFGYQILATAGGRVQAVGNYTISGGANYHWGSFDGSSVSVQSRTVTLTGTPAFAGAFAIASRAASIPCNACTFSGAATGTRYSATGNGVIDTAGGGATYLPGNSVGSTATGGQYL